ncbi:hypothetical protein [Micrococcus terreus]|uniref:Asparagine synthase (Glutamine-hydrolysing) n=1 Tax=Micrococcus terreus TaxID=574650 RepID=A0A1I7MGK1_9MICC|nr:hypothetical protein [Micrococcus terreus]SFV21057.1 hypothetical protein SAMN04487966_102158 [Micrococcus terreus]
MLLLTSRTRNPEHFEGYAFVGADYINGETGLSQYRRSTGRSVPPGEDGCYVVARRVGRSLEVGTDANGIGRLFLYRSGSEWAIGSSYSGLIDHLRSAGWTLTANPARLRPFAIRQAFTMQLTTFQTAFEEVRLLPIGTTVLIRRGRLQIRQPQTPQITDYEHALEKYLTVWRTRVHTLLSDPRVSFTADLSGGADSRTVFAFLVDSGLFSTEDDRFTLLSGINQKADLAVARSIAADYALTVNGPQAAPRTLVSGDRAFAHWREHSLGVYTPVYVSATFQNPFEIHAHGGGGETGRQYYTASDPVDLLGQFQGKMPPADFDLWRHEVSSTRDELIMQAPDLVPSIHHYMQFRNRFHFGHIPQARPMFTPLNSKFALQALSALPMGERRRFRMDVMESLAPGLKDHPYDDPTKAPTDDELDHLTVLRPLGHLPSGQVYADPTVQESRPDDPVKRSFEQWQAAIEAAAQRPEVRRFIMGNAMGRTDQIITRLREQGHPFHSHSPESVQLSHLLMVDFTLS